MTLRPLPNPQALSPTSQPSAAPQPFSPPVPLKVNNTDEYGQYFPYSQTMNLENKASNLIEAIESLPLEDRRDLIMTFALQLGIVSDSTLARLFARLQDRLAEYDIPPDGIQSAAELKAARNLASTYRALTKLQKSKNLSPYSRPDKVAEAERLVAKFNFTHKEPVAPPRPRGRPRKRISAQPGQR